MGSGVIPLRAPGRLAGRLKRPMYGLPLLACLLALAVAASIGIRQLQIRPHLLGAPPQYVCGTVGAGVPATWTAAMASTWVIQDPTGGTCTGGITVPFGQSLTIDASGGPIAVLTHGGGINVVGGTLATNPNTTNTVAFDLEGDASSWPGIRISADGSGHHGSAVLNDVRIHNAVYGIDVSGGAASGSYGLQLTDSEIGGSFYDAVKTVDTPIQVVGHVDGSGHPTTVLHDSGAAGIEAALSGPPNTIGLTVAGVSIAATGNDGIVLDAQSQAWPISITNTTINRAGLFGIHLKNAINPVLENNDITCSGRSSPLDCTQTVTRYPAIALTSDTSTAQFNLSSSGVSGNTGHDNGMDAIALDGTATSDITWITPSDGSIDHVLGYLVSGGLTVPHHTLNATNATVKVARGITFQGGALAASGTTFTSLDDNGPAGVTNACPSTYLSSCPSPVGGNDWAGITLTADGSTPAVASLTGGAISHAATALSVVDSGSTTNGFEVSMNGTAIGPSSSDGVAATDASVKLAGTTISNVGGNGITASFSGPASAGLSVSNAMFAHNGAQAVWGRGLGGQPVSIVSSTIDQAGAYGIRLDGAGQGGAPLTLQSNTVTNSGTGALRYPAIYLNGVTARFPTSTGGTGIVANTGQGNGLDAIMFHGTVSGNLSWQTAQVNRNSSDPLGFLLDSGITLTSGSLTLHPGDVVKAFSGGQITLLSGTVDGSDTSSTATKVFTSLADNSFGVAACPSAVIPSCSAPTASDWGGLNLGAGTTATIANGLIRFATRGIGVLNGTGITLTSTSMNSIAGDGINAQATPLSVTGGTFSTIGQHGIDAALGSGGNLTVSATQFVATGNEAILGTGLNGKPVAITGVTVDRAGTYGIQLQNADQLTLQNTTVTNSGTASPHYPAIYLPAVTAAFGTAVAGNQGGGNGLDAIAFHGTATQDLVWQTAQASNAVHALGFLVDGNLSLDDGKNLTVNAGGIVKVEGGVITLNGGSLLGQDVSSSAAKVLTSLSDNGAGIATCPSALLSPCTGPTAGDWGGIVLGKSQTNQAGGATLVNASFRYPTTAIDITSGALSSAGSSSFGLVLSRTTIGPTGGDAIVSAGTPVSIDGGRIATSGGNGLTIDLGPETPQAAGLRITNAQFSGMVASAVNGVNLGGHSVWITGSRVQNSGGNGITLSGADQLVLRNNLVIGAGNGTLNAAAIYLPGVSADFTRNVRGNQGASNGLDAIVFDGAATTSFSWINPANSGSIHPLGYLLHNSLTMSGAIKLTVTNAVVKALTGGIQLDGATLSGNGSTFTSWRDPTQVDLCHDSRQSPFFACGQPAGKGDWAGIAISNDERDPVGSSSLVNSRVLHAATGITVTSGDPAAPGSGPFGLTLDNTEVGFSSIDGINDSQTPLSVTDGSSIHDVVGHGITAQLAGSGAATQLLVQDSSFSTTGKEAIFASAVTSGAIQLIHNQITGAATYGIQLAGVTSPTLRTNTIKGSGISVNGGGTFPAIYLNGVTAGDFRAGGLIDANTGDGTNGLNAIAFHGSTLGRLLWVTPSAGPALGYVLDGALSVAGDMTVAANDVVKALNGRITVNGNVVAGGAGSKLFTSLRDSAAPATCNSVLVKSTPSCTAAAGDWGGLTVNGTATLTGATISFDDGLVVNANGGTGLTYTGGAMSAIKANAITVAGSAVSITNVNFASVGQDGIDSTNSGGGDVITDDSFSSVTGTSVKLVNAPADLERNNFMGPGPAINSSGAPVTETCADVQAGSIVGDGKFHIHDSNLSNGVTVSSTSAAPPLDAANNWWSSASGPGSLTNVTTSPFYTTAPPSLDPTSVNPTDTSIGSTQVDVSQLPAPLNGPNDALGLNTAHPTKPFFGQGTYEITERYNRSMNVNIIPTTNFALNIVNPPIQTTVRPLAGSANGWQDDHTWEGSATLSNADPRLVPGSYLVQITAAQDCIRNSSTNQMTPAQTDFMIDVNTLPSVTITAPTRLGGHSMVVNGTVVPNGWASNDQIVLTPTVSGHLTRTYHLSATDVPKQPGPVTVAFLATGLDPGVPYTEQISSQTVNTTSSGVTAARTDTTTGEVSQFAFSGTPNTIVAGVPFGGTITAEDGSGTPVADYTGTVDFTSSDTNAMLPANHTFTTGDAADNGVFPITNGFALKTVTPPAPAVPGPQTLAVADIANRAVRGSTQVVVTPSSPASLILTGLNGSVAGVSQSATVTAFDAFSNVATGYRGTVHFTSTDTQAVLPADYTFTTADDGAHIFSSAIALKTAATQSVEAADTVTPALRSTQPGLVVTPAAANHLVAVGPATSRAGSPFALTVTATDPFGNTDTSYTGTVHFTSTDGQASAGSGLPSDHTFSTSASGDNGLATFTGVVLKTVTPPAPAAPSAQTITATDTLHSGITGSAGVVVTPATATGLLLSAPATREAGSSFTVMVTATDPFGNTDTNYAGTVHFTSSDGQAVLPSDHTFTTGGGGDNGVASLGVTLKTVSPPAPAPPGPQTVNATDVVHNAVNGSANVVVTPAAAARFTVTVPGSAISGSGFGLTVTALDAFNNVATGYSGTVTFTSTDGTATSGSGLPANSTLTNGTRAFSGIILKTVGNQTVTATDTVTSAVLGTSSAIRIDPASFVVSSVSTARAGVAFDVTVTAEDATNSVATGYRGTVHFSSTDGNASLPTDYTFQAGDSGAKTFSSGVVLKTVTPPAPAVPGTQTVAATDTVDAMSTGSTAVTVTPAAASHLVLAAPSTSQAGASFSLTVTATDQFGNTDTNYSGTVHFTSTDGQASAGSGLPADHVFTTGAGNDNGIAPFAGVTLKTVTPAAPASPTAQTVMATDTVQGTITGSAGIIVTPASADHLVLAAPTTSQAGGPFSITATATDHFGNTDTNYTGTVHLTSSDGQAALAADHTFVSSDSGAASLGVTLKTVTPPAPATPMAQTVNAADKLHGSIQGSANVIVTPAAAASLVVTAPTSALSGSAFDLTVTAMDPYNNVATGYTGTVHFTSSDGTASSGSGLPADTALVGGDKGARTFSSGATLKTVGSQTITATDGGSALTGTSGAIRIDPSSFTVTASVSTVQAGTAFDVTVAAKDATNSVATGYRGTVHFTSSDTSAGLPADYTFLAGDNGLHAFSAGVTLKTVTPPAPAPPATQTITVTDAADPLSTGNVTVTVTPGNAASLVLTVPSSATHGVAFSLTITALDAFGNVATGYTGTVTFSSSDTGAGVVLPGATIFTVPNAGSQTLTGVILQTTGAQTITATDTVLSVTSSAITVS